MKRRTLIVTLIVCCTTLFGQVHITVGDPATWSAQELAPYVGQTVVFDAPIVVCSNASSTLTVSPWRIFQPENQGVPGSEGYKTALHINGTTAMSLSGVSGYHRCGEKIYNLKAMVNSTYSLTWVSGEWRGNTRAELEDSIPDLGDYRLLVCGFNLENYFVANYGSMGAKNYTEHQKQRKKIHKALMQINADLYGLVELEKGDEAISEIVDDLNNDSKERNYQFFSDVSTSAVQKVDFVYDANVLEPIGTPGNIDTEVQHRKKMLCFREKATGEKFIFSINHFKAMSGGSDSETRRVNEARAVLSFYNSYRVTKSIREEDLLLMGDLNSYGYAKPIRTLVENNLIDLHRVFHADSSYSYMFSGKASYIDHAICNSTMCPQITGMAAYHINSDEDDYYTYDKSSGDMTMFRCSDHDPVLVGLKLDSTLTYNPSPAVNAAEVLSGESDMFTIRNAKRENERSFYAIVSVSGVVVEMQEITSSMQEVRPPLQAGVYILYIYYDGQVYQKKIIVR